MSQKGNGSDLKSDMDERLSKEPLLNAIELIQRLDQTTKERR